MHIDSIQTEQESDPIARKLKQFSLGVLIVVFGILPLFFIPSLASPLGYSKILFVLVGVLLALLVFSLYTLRSGEIAIKLPYAVGGLWLVFGVSLLSTLLSGDFKDAFVGDEFSVHSTAFLGLMALTATIWVLIGAGKSSVMKLYMLVAASALVLVIFHILRLVFGTDVLSFGVFSENVSSLIGGWNDLALFLGLAILLSLVALEQLPLTKWGKWLFGVVTIAALLMLSVINFFYVWIVLAVLSLVMVVYALKKPKEAEGSQYIPTKMKSDMSSLILAGIVFITSGFFVIGGSSIGGSINELTGISFIEVRPSFEATAEIAREVYKENAFLGIGTNKFSDAWKLHKNEAINATVFWNTDFSAGNGYITTFFITTGVLGALAWIVFLALFILMGVRMLIRSAGGDRMWYFIGLSAFVSASYVWGMSIVYVPGPVVLLIGALCTGLTFLAHNALSESGTRAIVIGEDRRTGFILTLVVIAVIITSVGIFYSTVRHYNSVVAFRDSVLLANTPGTNITVVEEKVTRALELAGSDTYARRLAEIELARMNQLLVIQSPSAEQQQQFNEAFQKGVTNGRLAIEEDPLESTNWAVLGEMYSVLAIANVEGMYESAGEALNRALELDPKNPARYLALATLEARRGNIEEAKTYTDQAINLKANYSDAFFLQTQLSVAAGNVEEAVVAAQSVLQLEPNNPARYYQLGVLESSRGNLQVATVAFETAVRLDPNYANAMYFLALSYDASGRSGEAKTLLERVLRLNPGNADVAALIEQLETEGSLNLDIPSVQPVASEEVGVSEEAGVVSSDRIPDSSVLTPVNIAPEVESVEDEPAPVQLESEATDVQEDDEAPGGDSDSDEE